MFEAPLSEVEKLVVRHGGEAYKLLQCWSKLERSMALSLFIEVHHAITNTMCLSLKDFYLRRVPLFLSEIDHGLAHIQEISDIFTNYFHWDENQRQGQINDLKEVISRELHWKN